MTQVVLTFCALLLRAVSGSAFPVICLTQDMITAAVGAPRQCEQSRGAFLPGVILWKNWRAFSACGQGVGPAKVVTTAAFKTLFARRPLS